MFVADEFSKQALISLDFSLVVCYNLWVFKNLSVPPSGERNFYAFFRTQCITAFAKAVMHCVLILVISILADLESIRNEY